MQQHYQVLQVIIFANGSNSQFSGNPGVAIYSVSSMGGVGVLK